MFGPKGPFCQSCGMPLSKDKLGGGTNKDGSKNADYCGNCYKDGQFVEPELTVVDMQAKLTRIMKNDMHLPGFMANYFTKGIPQLKRWSQNQ